ncbi:hypothetical protein [Streptomyces sp. 1222.5]|uniref:hypothetical protein n=1 Tax=Streptomyces sp. 1222.5 TaxID=1881026 RepID=UPI003D763352
MDDDEIRARFDGRGVVELRGGVSLKARAERVAYVLGYELVSTEQTRGPGLVLGLPRPPATVGLVFRRDDDPRARRRAERTVERLRAGGPLLADDEALLPPAASARPGTALRPPAAGAPSAPVDGAAATAAGGTVRQEDPAAAALPAPRAARSAGVSHRQVRRFVRMYSVMPGG